MRVKVHGGTARHGDPSLCTTCRYATIVRGPSLRDEIVQCSRLSSPHDRVAFPVTFCNGFVDRNHPSLDEMEDIAWILRSDPKRHEMGFVKASSLKARDRYVLSEE